MNRYTQLTPAQFSPLSLQEMMMVPLAKQKQYDSALAEISENKLFGNKYMQEHAGIVDAEMDSITSGLKAIEDDLMANGDVGSIKKRLLDLAAKRKQFLSPSGIGGKAEAAYNAYLKNVDNINKMNISGEYKNMMIQKAKKNYQALQSQIENDVANYSDYYGPKIQDLNQYALNVANSMSTVDTTTYTDDELIRVKRKAKEDIVNNVYKTMIENPDIMGQLQLEAEFSGDENYIQNKLAKIANNVANLKYEDDKHVTPRGKSGTGSDKDTSTPKKKWTFTYQGTLAQPQENVFDVGWGKFTMKDVREQIQEVDNQILNAQTDAERTELMNKKELMNTVYNSARSTIEKENENLSYDNLLKGTNITLNDSGKLLNDKELLEVVSAMNIKGLSQYDRGVHVNKNIPKGHVPILKRNGAQAEEIGYMSIKDYKKIKEKKDLYNEKLSEHFKKNSIIPISSLSFNKTKTADENKVFQSMNEIATTSLRRYDTDILKTIKDPKEKDRIAKYLENPKDVQVTGIEFSEELGTTSAVIQTPEGILKLPLEISTGGKFEGPGLALLNKMQETGAPEVRQAINQIKFGMMAKDITVDNSSSSLFNFNATSTKNYKDLAFKALNKGINTKLVQKLRNSKNIRLFSNKNVDFEGESYPVSAEYKGLAYGDNEYVTIKDIISNNLEQSDKFPKDKNGKPLMHPSLYMLQDLYKKINNGVIHIPGGENNAKMVMGLISESFSGKASSESQKKLIEIFENTPFLTNNKSLLVNFEL